MFASAVGYERLMGRWSAQLAPMFADFAQVQDGGRVLDVGCGTGALAKAIADTTRRCEIVGIDPARPSVDYARAQCAHPRIRFEYGDALELGFPTASFDQTLSLLVLMFIPESEKATAEMRRVTRPGGTLAACTWERGGIEMASLFWDEAVRLDPDAAARSRGPGRLSREGELGALWRSQGLQDVSETVLEMQMNFSSFDDFWQPHLYGVGPQGVYVAGLSTQGREALREGLRGRCLGERPDGAFSLRARALAVRGTVPD